MNSFPFPLQFTESLSGSHVLAVVVYFSLLLLASVILVGVLYNSRLQVILSPPIGIQPQSQRPRREDMENIIAAAGKPESTDDYRGTVIYAHRALMEFLTRCVTSVTLGGATMKEAVDALLKAQAAITPASSVIKLHAPERETVRHLLKSPPLLEPVKSQLTILYEHYERARFGNKPMSKGQYEAVLRALEDIYRNLEAQGALET